MKTNLGVENALLVYTLRNERCFQEPNNIQPGKIYNVLESFRNHLERNNEMALLIARYYRTNSEEFILNSKELKDLSVTTIYSKTICFVTST